MASVQAIGIGALLTAVILHQTAPASSADLACADFLRMHGMLRKAAGPCGFSTYNPAIVHHAHACFDALGGHQGAAEMYAGAAQFDRLQSDHGNEAVCATLARTFPMVVRP